VKEPQRDEIATAEPCATEQEDSRPQELAVEPKVYAFDGWGMVPLELDLA
jgi:hypothetical protein